MQVAILGLGLMGGSLGLALVRRGLARVTAYARRDVTRARALELGAADAVFEDPAAAVDGADIVVLCVPVLSSGAVLEACRPKLAPACVVTDVGSTKVAVAAQAEAVLAGTGVPFVGSHPICGSEETGLDAARAALYEGAHVVLTPGPAACRAAVDRVEALWTGLGSRVKRMDAQTHDDLIARTSHLPHLVAAVLAGSVCRDDTDIAPLCGSGVRDTTRIAAGSEEIWHDIVETNPDAIRRELDLFAARLDALRARVAAGDFEAVRGILADCRARRITALGRGGDGA